MSIFLMSSLSIERHENVLEFRRLTAAVDVTLDDGDAIMENACDDGMEQQQQIVTSARLRKVADSGAYKAMLNEQVYEEVSLLFLIFSHCPKVKRKQESRKHQNPKDLSPNVTNEEILT